MYTYGPSHHRRFLKRHQSQLVCEVMKTWKCQTVQVLHAHMHLFPELEKSQPSLGAQTADEVQRQACQATKCTITLLAWVVLWKTCDKNFFVNLTHLPCIRLRCFIGWYTLILISRAPWHHYLFLRKGASLHWDKEGKGWRLFSLLSLVTEEYQMELDRHNYIQS